MELGFEVSSTAQDEHAGPQAAFPPSHSPHAAGCFIYPSFTQSSPAFYIKKSIMLDSKSTSRITLTNSVYFVYLNRCYCVAAAFWDVQT